MFQYPPPIIVEFPQPETIVVSFPNYVVLGGVDLSVLVVGETPVGAMNGSNATFTSAFAFAPDTVEVYLNGVRQVRIDDYNSSGVNTVVLAFAPLAGEDLKINYRRA